MSIHKRSILATIFLETLFITSLVCAQSTLPRMIKFSGSAPVGAGSVTFAIYGTEDGLAPLWLETQSVTADESGHYTVILGSTTAAGLPASIFSSGEARWIGVKVGDQPEAARTLLVSVPYALKAGDAETLGGKPLSAFVLAGSPTTAAISATKRILESGKAAPELNGAGDLGTLNHLAKFTTTGSTLGDSTLVEVGGRLGIGTTSPNYPLELVGPNVELLQRNANPSSYAGMRFYNDQNSNVRALEIDYSGSAYPSILAIGGPVGESASVATTGAFPLTLGTSNTARVTISGSGNVGIGTISPATKLDVAGTIHTSGGVTFADSSSQTTAVPSTCTTNQVPQWNGTAWICATLAGGGGGGTVTSITAGDGLTGGTITTSGTITVDGSVARTTGNNFNGNQTITATGIALTANGLGANSIGVLGTSNDTTGVGVQGQNAAGCSAPGANAICGKMLVATDGATKEILRVDINGTQFKAPIVNAINNDAVTGTTSNLLVKLSTAGKAIVTVTGDVGGAIGVAGFNAGNVGKTWVASIGVANCQFDNQTVSADYVTIGASGQCHDAGAKYPSAVQVLGRATQPNTGPGTLGQVYLFGTEARGIGPDTLSLAAVAFSGLEAKVNGNGAVDNNASGTNNGWHSIELPSGSVISALRICGRDDDSGGQIVATLFRKARAGDPNGSPADQIASAASGTVFANTTAQCFSSINLSAAFATIDNTQFTYFVEMSLTSFVQANAVEIDH